MKVAFHFDCNVPGLGVLYGDAIQRKFFSQLLQLRPLRLATKVYLGDLLMLHLASTSKARENALSQWVETSQNGWRRFTERIQRIAETDVFVICLESVGMEIASRFHDLLSREKAYLGAIQVDDAAEIHWLLYSSCLSLRYRLNDRSISLIHEVLNGGPLNTEEMAEEKRRIKGFGFDNVEFENANGKHTFFDQYHSFEHARRVAEWKAKFGDCLGFMTEEVVCRLGDHIPELPDKLWAAVDTFQNAETDEQYAQVSASCRRILEFVADRLFPPTEEIRKGRKLGPKEYRNRILAFVEDQSESGTQIDLICSGLDLFAQHVEKLQNLANKGIHSEIQREGARRALLRTVFLLDDIVCLNPRKFPIQPKLDFSILTKVKD